MICGNNDTAQLGWDPQVSPIPEHLLSSTIIDPDALSITVPARVASLDAFSVHHAAAGLTHMCAVVGDGLLASWGGNDWGQLGDPFPISCFQALPRWPQGISSWRYNDRPLICCKWLWWFAHSSLADTPRCLERAHTGFNTSLAGETSRLAIGIKL